MTTVAQFLDWARSQIGTKESPPSSNHVRYWDVIGKSSYQGQPWCGAFVSSANKETGLHDPLLDFVYCPSGRANAAKAGRLVSVPSPGYIPFYEFENDSLVDHTGIVESTGPGFIVAIEGNTVGEGMSGSQADGGGVFRRKRPLSLCRGFIRPLFDTGVTPPMHLVLNAAIVDERNCPTGGAWILTEDGGVFAFGGAPFKGSPVGQDYWGNRKAAKFGDPIAGATYQIVDTAGETYNY